MSANSDPNPQRTRRIVRIDGCWLGCLGIFRSMNASRPTASAGLCPRIEFLPQAVQLCIVALFPFKLARKSLRRHLPALVSLGQLRRDLRHVLALVAGAVELIGA